MATIAELIERVSERYNARDLVEACRAAEEILAIDPDHVLALRVTGVTLRDANPAESERRLTRALALEPTSAALHFEIGVTLMAVQRHEEAYRHFERAVAIKPIFQAAYVNLSAIAEQQQWHEEALRYGRQAVALKPDCALGYYNMANALREQGRMDDSTECLLKAVELAPALIKAQWNLGMNYLLVGDFRQGWPRFEHREAAEEVEFDKHVEPRWQGEPLAGKTIVVHAEQGVGDEILFASCLDDVIARAEKCILTCDPRLARLFARSFPKAMVYGFARRTDRAPAPIKQSVDFQLPAGSLPLYTRPDWESFPARTRFLVTDPANDERWRERYAALGPGLKVGISWRAGGKPLERRKRSVPLGELWRGVLSMPDAHFVNLQYGDATADLAAARERFGVEVHDWDGGDPLVDMDDYASKIAGLDLVISVGNATVHMAGAVGTPAWTLLPMIPSWRWMVSGERTPWYSSVRLLRQSTPDDWMPVFDRVQRDLAVLCGNAGSASVSTPAAIAASVPAAPRESDRWLEAAETSAKVMVEQMGAKLEAAAAARAAGALLQSEQLYREVLLAAPRHPLALAGLGIVAGETGRWDLAVRSLQRACAADDRSPSLQYHLAGVLKQADRLQEAAEAYRRVLQLDPACEAAQREMGEVLAALCGSALPADRCGAVLGMSDHDPATHVIRGRSLLAHCRIDEAIASFGEALRLRPDMAEARIALGMAYFEDQRIGEAENCFRAVLKTHSDSVQARVQLGRALQMQGRMEAATAEWKIALDGQPDCLPALVLLGAARRDEANPAEAAKLYQRALTVRPDSPELHNSLGLALADLGRFDEAIAQFDKALLLDPNLAGAHHNRGLVLIQTGRFDEGWREYEWRWKRTGGARPRTFFSQKPWNGESLAGKTILIHGEQAISDEIMFATCYRDVIERAGQCVILCDRRLEGLFGRSLPRAHVFGVTRGREHQWRAPAGMSIDVQIAAGSLPGILRKHLDQFPRQRQLLSADRRATAEWRARYAALGTGLKIGMCWLAGENELDRRTRSTALNDWSELFSLSATHWINFQHGEGRKELEAWRKRTGRTIHSFEGTGSDDFDDLAARVAALDMVIAVGGTTVHLAGSLGVETWALLPQWQGWRWLVDRQDTPWYASVRLFRQCGSEGWNELFGRVRQELLNRRTRPDEETRMPSIGPPHVALWPVATPVAEQT